MNRNGIDGMGWAATFVVVVGAIAAIGTVGLLIEWVVVFVAAMWEWMTT